MINFNDDKYKEKESKLIFNNGDAGVARECKCRIQKRTADDNINAPLYKLFFTDKNGAEINRGIFETTIKTTDASKVFLVKECRHLLSQCGLEIEKDREFSNENEILNYAMVSCKDVIKDIKFGVAVCYGTVKKPNSFLEIDGFWGYINETNIVDGKPLKLSQGALLRKIEPKTADDFTITKKPINDLPF